MTCLLALALLGLSCDAEAARRSRGVVIDDGAGWTTDHYLDLSADPTSPPFCEDNNFCPRGVLGFALNVDGVIYDRVWVDRNGFISLGRATDNPAQFFSNLTSLSAFQGNLIAPFYSANEVSPNTSSQCDARSSPEDCDIEFSHYPDPDDPDESSPLIPNHGFRITWGISGGGELPLETRTRGVSRADVAPAQNRFQVLLSDRLNGNFDVMFNYDYLEWEDNAPLSTTRSQAGLKIGPYTLDFRRWYSTFKGVNDDPENYVAGLPTCTGPTLPLSQGIFDPAVPFVCNNITVRFTNGVPELLGFTAPLTVTAVAPMGTVYSGESVEFGWDVQNAGPQATTNATIETELPQGFTYLGSTGATCTPSGRAVPCTLALSAGQTAQFRITAQSTNFGVQNVDAAAAALQYDPTPGNNAARVSFTLTENANLRLDSCTAISVAANVAATFSCTVSNLGPQPATPVQLSFVLPAFLSFGSGTGCTAVGATVTCGSGTTLTAGSSTVFTAQLNATAAGSASIVSTVSGTPVDRASGNNSNTVTATVSSSSSSSSGGGGGGGGGGALHWPGLLALLAIAASVGRDRYNMRASLSQT